MATTSSATARRGRPSIGLAALDFAIGSHRRVVAMLTVLALVAFLPGFFSEAPKDRDEARFAQATKQMLETGDYVDIRFLNEVRYKKPVGVYWLQAAAVKTAAAVGVADATTTAWLYRIPSLIGAVGAVLLTYWAALAFVSRRAAVLAAVMMAGSILLGVEARLAKTDAMLLLTTVAAMGAMARLYLRTSTGGGERGWTLPAIFWTALAGGVLLKGPVILLFVALAAATLAIVDRSARWLGALRPLPGLAWFLLLVLPWFIAIVSRAGDDFFVQSVGGDLLPKIFSSQEAHGAPPGYYLLLFFVTFWPAAPLAAMAAPQIWTVRHEPGARFLLAWVLPAWLLLELVITKLPHYVLPLYPAIAILTAGVLDSRLLSRARWLVRATVWWFLIPVAVGGASIGALIMIERDLGLLAWPVIGAAIIIGLLAWLLYEADGAERSLLRATAASILLAFGVYGIVLPSFSALFPSPAVARIVKQAGCPNPVVAAAGYQEPSLVFLLGSSTQLADGAYAAEFLRQGPCRFAVIESRAERSFVQRADAIGARYALEGRLNGINISVTRRITLSVYRSQWP
jgi:4-amino-4-deoxy-L-arabinose transferase-like glycosyltransferase